MITSEAAEKQQLGNVCGRKIKITEIPSDLPVVVGETFGGFSQDEQRNTGNLTTKNFFFKCFM